MTGQLSDVAAVRGVRAGGGARSAMMRQLNRWAAMAMTMAGELAAAYAFGVARNHPFVDGNKRTAWGASRGACSSG